MNLKFHIPWNRLLCLVLAAAVAGCSVAPPGGAPGKVLESQAQRVQNPDAAPADVQALADGNTVFALDFYRSVSALDGNLFFSPYSLSTALAMTYAGARGATESQMAEAMHYTLPQDRLHPAFNALDLQLNAGAAAGEAPAGDDEAQNFQLSVANSLWGQQDYTFLPEYLDLLAMHYGAGMRLMDFKSDPEAARQAINTWVEQQTQERIKDLIPAGGLDSAARLVLANAIYFKADWLHTFEPNNTRPLSFHRLDGSTVETPMMSYEHATELPYYEGDGFQAVELPYQGGEASMLVLLPAEGRFAEFEAGLDAAVLQAVTDGFQPVNVELILPKFEYTAEYGLADVLGGMGMPDAFCSGAPDFSGMDGTQNLCIGQVFHKAFVAVDEKGTEAAAATAVVMEAMAMLIEDVKIVQVDRPFIFAIRHNPTGSILFLGRVLDPTP